MTAQLTWSKPNPNCLCAYSIRGNGIEEGIPSEDARSPIFPRE